MTELDKIINKEKIDLLIWDFDGVIYDLDWNYPNPSTGFVEQLYSKIAAIDKSIVKDKAEFIARKFPYPEINEIGIKHGREVQLEVKSLYLSREMSSADRAIPNPELIQFINKSQKHQVIWSNNYSDTINYLLNKAQIKDKIKLITSLDKVIMSKPNIEGFNLIKARFPLIKNENILLVGDSLISDKIAAQNSGIKFFRYIKQVFNL
jgi:HAD superfamily hydrolase (TIGR01549 family)